MSKIYIDFSQEIEEAKQVTLGELMNIIQCYSQAYRANKSSIENNRHTFALSAVYMLGKYENSKRKEFKNEQTTDI